MSSAFSKQLARLRERYEIQGMTGYGKEFQCLAMEFKKGGTYMKTIRGKKKEEQISERCTLKIVLVTLAVNLFGLCSGFAKPAQVFN